THAIAAAAIAANLVRPRCNIPVMVAFKTESSSSLDVSPRLEHVSTTLVSHGPAFAVAFRAPSFSRGMEQKATLQDRRWRSWYRALAEHCGANALASAKGGEARECSERGDRSPARRKLGSCCACFSKKVCATRV